MGKHRWTNLQKACLKARRHAYTREDLERIALDYNVPYRSLYKALKRKLLHSLHKRLRKQLKRVSIERFSAACQIPQDVLERFLNNPDSFLV